MKFSAGARARAIAGLTCGALLAAAVSGGTDVADAPPGAPGTIIGGTGDLPVAVDENGEAIPVSIGDPPEIELASATDRILERAEKANDAAPPDLQMKQQPGRARPAGPQADPETLLVTFEPATTEAAAAAALDKAGVTGRRLADSTTYEVATADQDHAELTESLAAADAVAAVDPNRIVRASKVPNDPQTATQRHYLDGLGVPAAWDVASTGAGVTVAVLDTGVDLDHPDLAPNLVAGYNAVTPSASAQDDHGHGTQVAGIIGAATNNGVGIAGIAWNAKIMPVKVLNAQGYGTDADLIEGIRWAAGHGAKVINMSLGAPGGSTAIDNAVRYALGFNDNGTYQPDRGAVLVGAAGNDGAPYVDYPAGAPGVIAVSATDHAGDFAWYSNHSLRVDLAATGIDVRSTALAPGTDPAVDDGTGTSFSSPIVAGVVALVRERHPGWAWDLIYDEVLRTATDRGPAGADASYGYGLVNAAAAVGAGGVSPVTQADLAGDAGNFPAGARSIAPGATATETIGYVDDEDWFTFNVGAAGGATVTVTPPPFLDPGIRAHEIDPQVEVYGPGGGLVAEMDDGFAGEREQLRFNAAAGAHRIHVRNYLGSSGPATYSVRVDVGAAVPVSSLAAAANLAGLTATTSEPVIADVTDDGRADVIVGGTIGGVSGNYVLAQQPDGSLTVLQRLDTHTGAITERSIAVGDFDGDGDNDIAFSTGWGLEVSWNTDTGIEAPVQYNNGGGHQSLSAVQLDATPALELIDTNSTTYGTILLERWNGTTFVNAEINLQGDDYSNHYRVGDVNGDGRPDIVAAASNRVTVFAQEANGTWTPDVLDTPLPLGMGFDHLAVADVSGDGLADVVLPVGDNGEPEPHLLYTYLQEDDGTLDGPYIGPTGADPLRVLTAELSGDDRDDVLVLHDSSYAPNAAVGIHRQTPFGRVAPLEKRTDLPDGISRGFAAGDVTGDGRDDVVVAHSTGLLLLRHQVSTATTPETTRPWFASTAPAPNATNVATSARPVITFGRDIDPASVRYGFDFDSTVWMIDSRNGLAIDATATLSGGRTLTITPSRALTPGTPYLVSLWDVRDPAGNWVVQTFTFTTAAAGPTSYRLGAEYYPFSVDLDANGYDEVIWFTPGTNSDPIWGHDAEGRFDISPVYMQGSLRPVAGDFDGNGYEDIFWYAPGTAADVMWYLGLDAVGDLVITTKTYPINSTYVPVAGDFDGNGYEDIFWYGPGAAAESVWKFRAGRVFTAVNQSKVNATGFRITAGDFDRDGFDDVFWHLPGTGGEAIWRGGPSTFRGIAAPAANGNYNIRAGDYNGDGYDDIYWFASNVATLALGNPTGFTGRPGPVIAGTARPVAGEYTGDLRDDLVAYVPGTTADRLLTGRPTGLG